MITTLVTHTLADVVADGAHYGAAGRIGRDHQGQHRVGETCGVIGAQFAAGQLYKDPVGYALTQTGKLDHSADEAGPQAQPPARGGEAGHNICFHAEKNRHDRRGKDTHQIFRYGPDYPHENGPHEYDQHAFSLGFKPVEGHKGHQRAEQGQYKREDEFVSLLSAHVFISCFLKNFPVWSRPGAGSRCRCMRALPRETKKPTNGKMP